MADHLLYSILVDSTVPGARVDSEVPLYGLSFPEVWKSWNFSCKYPDYKELRQYFNHLDEKLQLRKDCSFNHRVHSAHWDDSKQQWTSPPAPARTRPSPATAQHVIFCLVFLQGQHPQDPRHGQVQGSDHPQG